MFQTIANCFGSEDISEATSVMLPIRALNGWQKNDLRNMYADGITFLNMQKALLNIGISATKEDIIKIVCPHNYTRRITNRKPIIKSSRFDGNDNARLCSLVRILNREWEKIALEMPGKTPRGCKHQYTTCLDPSLSIIRFTPEEDICILQLVIEYGQEWKAFAPVFGPLRTAQDIRNRWYAIRTIYNPVNNYEKWNPQNEGGLEGAKYSQRKDEKEGEKEAEPFVLETMMDELERLDTTNFE